MGVYCGLLSVTAYIIVGALFAKTLLAHLYALDGIFIGTVGVSSAALALWAWLSFRRFQYEPEASRIYGGKVSVRVVNVLYVVVPLVWLLVLGLMLQWLDAV